jgi:lipopolysaccharide transport system permease protein
VDRKWLSELWRYRELVFFLAWRDVKVRYKQAALGIAWVILQPLATMIVFTLFLGNLPGMQTDDVPYALFTYSALVLWTYVSGVIGQAGQSLVSNTNLITKVYFPRVALPMSSAVSALLDLVIGLGFLAMVIVYYHVFGNFHFEPGPGLLLMPVFLLALMMLTIGASLLLSALNVQYRDVKHAVPFLLQIWMFVTPVIYPLTIVPERFRPLMALNPLTGIVEGFRACLFSSRPFDPSLTAISLTMTAVVFMAGVVYFRKTERAFADVI